MEFASYIELFYNSRKWEWCAVSYFSAFQGISPLISSSKRSLSPPSPSPLGEAPSPPFLRYGVSHFSLSGTLPFTANEKDPSASLGMTIRETCFPLFFYLALVIHPADRHFERSEKSFSSPFSHDSFAMPFTGSTAPTFSRYGVSHSLLSDTRRLTANEKDPSAPLGMTIRETCFLNTIFSRSTEMPISRLFTSLSFISRL